MGLMLLMNKDLPQFGLEFGNMERFNPEAATGGAP